MWGVGLSLYIKGYRCSGEDVICLHRAVSWYVPVGKIVLTKYRFILKHSGVVDDIEELDCFGNKNLVCS